MSSTRKKDIQFGTKNLLVNDEFDSENGEQRISLMLDIQVIEAFKNLAKKEGKKYQVLIRDTLRETVFNKKNNIENRLKELEKAVFKKRA